MMTAKRNHRTTHRRTPLFLAAALVLAALASTPSGAQQRKFYGDDPLTREPETQDASGAQEVEIDLFFDLALNLFGNPGDKAVGVRAQNINTIDEVPDSSWFTNRILARNVPIEEAVRGPLTDDGPVPGTWTVIRPKVAGFAPGFTMRDAKGTTWFVSFDARGYPEAATGAILVANKIFWTLGYWQVENYLIQIRKDQLTIADDATFTAQSGIVRAMKASDLDDVLRRSQVSADGTYRAIAARAVPGKPLGGFRYHGTRSDDPNDVVPHEHRRELRALKVFGAWTNLVDMKAGNTLDTLMTEKGRAHLRHYLQDVGSTFGTGANGPREYDEGWEYLFEGDLTMKRLLRLGFYFSPWQTADYVDNPAIGRFEADAFDPLTWRPRVPTAAFRHARADDSFWAARRVMAFSDDLIRAIVKTGRYTDPAAEKLLADVLIERRNKIGAAYLTAINPVVNVALDESGRVTFQNAAVAAGVAKAPAGGYLVRWFTFDNNSNTATAIGTPTVVPSAEARAPGTLPASGFVKLEISGVQPEHASWATPISVYFRRAATGWVLVGVDRLP
ncbi:MAG TPA: hypothetical protein VFJ02_15390 [Vicinamibacterales bacterium]|nr:hypothetical protein [Vicinamibacterales bacterium]